MRRRRKRKPPLSVDSGGLIYCGLFFRGGTDGAVICTSAAGNASVSIDNVFAVTLGDSLYGAICCTSAAGDAFVTDFVCH